jgi:hypothetical protein
MQPESWSLVQIWCVRCVQLLHASGLSATLEKMGRGIMIENAKHQIGNWWWNAVSHLGHCDESRCCKACSRLSKHSCALDLASISSMLWDRLCQASHARFCTLLCICWDRILRSLGSLRPFRMPCESQIYIDLQHSAKFRILHHSANSATECLEKPFSARPLWISWDSPSLRLSRSLGASWCF